MNLENLESKEPLIRDFFTWLFDDDRIINKEVILEKEIDLTLAPYYMDPNIYFPKQIFDFFNTKAMKRLGRVSQLGLVINDFPNTYHNRLDHSKGVYYRKLEEMLYNFQNPDWKKNIESQKMKLYLLADLIKMAGHDIGHPPLSHELEMHLFQYRGAHEVIGKRIMLEDSEIQSLLNSISKDLPNALKNLYKEHIFNFQEHDESSYDVDRFDYLSRDNLYLGTPVFIPYSHYITVPVDIDSSGYPKLNSDNSVVVSTTSNSYIDVYDYSSLNDIEDFLELRENGYLNIYSSSKTNLRENSIGALIDVFQSSDSKSGRDLRTFMNMIKSSDLNTLDLDLFLKWDDIKFYSEILDIAENHEDSNIRLLATMTIPTMKSFLTIIYSHLEIHAKNHTYTPEEKEFLKKIKGIIQGKNILSQNLKNPDFSMDNTLIFSSATQLPEDYHNSGLINSFTTHISAYNNEEPIYIMGKNKRIYELSKHPDRKCDWDKRITYTHSDYAFVPILKYNGISDEQISEMRSLSETQKESGHRSDNGIFSNSCTVNMQPLQVGHNIENKFLEL